MLGRSGFMWKVFWGPNSMVSAGHQSQVFQEDPLVRGGCALSLRLVHNCCRHAGAAMTVAGFLVDGTSHPGDI